MKLYMGHQVIYSPKILSTTSFCSNLKSPKRKCLSKPHQVGLRGHEVRPHHGVQGPHGGGRGGHGGHGIEFLFFLEMLKKGLRQLLLTKWTS